MEKQRTFEDFAIREIERLREENEVLKCKIAGLLYLERLVENIKKDFKPTYNKSKNGNPEYIRINDFYTFDSDKIKYYKGALQLEECEENEPEEETIKS